MEYLKDTYKKEIKSKRGYTFTLPMAELFVEDVLEYSRRENKGKFKDFELYIDDTGLVTFGCNLNITWKHPAVGREFFDKQGHGMVMSGWSKEDLIKEFHRSMNIMMKQYKEQDNK